MCGACIACISACGLLGCPRCLVAVAFCALIGLDTLRVVGGNLAEGPKWQKLCNVSAEPLSDYAVTLMATRSTEEQKATLRMLVTIPSTLPIDSQGALALPLLVLGWLLL